MSPITGFTLLELLVVMAILALVAAVTTPWFARLIQRNHLKSAAREVQTTILATRMRAVKRNLNASMLVVTAAAADSSHRLEVIEGDTRPPVPSPPPVVKYDIAKKAGSFVILPAGGKITFAGDGRMITPGPAAAPAVFVVRGVEGSGLQNDITINVHMNGRVHVVTPTAWK